MTEADRRRAEARVWRAVAYKLEAEAIHYRARADKAERDAVALDAMPDAAKAKRQRRMDSFSCKSKS